GSITTVAAAETPEGTALGDITAFRGTSTTGVFGGPCASVGDPIVYPLNQTVRGINARIDPTRYRILTAELGLPNLARNICEGSVVRVVWHIDGEAQENVSDDIVLDSRVGANVLNTINLDMAALPVDPASPAITGWTGSIKSFRIDPHEFANPTPFYIRRIKLAALETANTSYVVRWTSSEASGTVSVYYDTDKDPTVKSFINSTTVSSTTGSLTWNTSALGTGEQYYVYVEFNDGTNTNGAYGKWPVRIDHSATAPRIVVSRPTLNFGVTALTTKTGPQTVRVTVVGSGSPCWTVDNSLPSVFTVSGGSGCGSGEFTVSLVNQNYNVLGVGEGTLTVRQVTPGTIDNSPQYVHAWIRIHGATGAPFGLVDTPVDNSVVSGSIAVTGWALDDIEITGVTIYRDPVPGEGSSLIFVGNAVRIDDARPDVEGLTGSTPFQYRAGWGFLVLTNFLPNGGEGAYVLRVYATDREGYATRLGSRTIMGANASSVRPFGAIDTPAQGETISGSSYPNFGWVLGRGSVVASPALGGSVTVFIDGVAVGSPCCWGARSDLTALFPASTYPGVNQALGVYNFNPSLLPNGLHTIAWGVTATNGQADGVGSRFFNVINSSVVASAASQPNVITARAEVSPGRSLGMATVALAQATPARFVTARAGTRVTIQAAGLEGSGPYEAYLSVGGVLRPLPIGSALDQRRGAFYWQPGPGFAGSYDLMFVRDGKRLPVHITLTHTASTGRRVPSPFSALFTASSN
ncbi:MAG: hypothetical protein LC753_07680, partial [Acidobacteria bacterium]|nr:hypothetical protein [Acidobacteriota bacterium]